MTSVEPIDSGFAHLHVHTSHSSLDGLAKLDEMFAHVAAMNQPAVAMTDHGTLGGIWKGQKAAKKHGVKLVPGVEVYLAIPDEYLPEKDRPADDGRPYRHRHNVIEVPRDGADEDGDEAGTATKRKTYEHLTILAKNRTGWRNLVSINNAAQEVDSFWGAPRADLPLLAQHREGLIVLTGCLGGPVAGRILAGDIDGARRNLTFLRDTLNGGPVPPEQSRLFVEVMYHGIEAEAKVLPVLFELAEEFGLPVVVTNDSHYIHDEDYEAHDAWLCVGKKVDGRAAMVSDTKRFRFNGDGYHLKSTEQMKDLAYDVSEITGVDLRDRWIQGVENSLLVVAQVEDHILPEPKLHLPRFPKLPEGKTSAEFMHQLVREGAIKRYGDANGKLPADVRTRLRWEEDVIISKGYEDYFLVVWDVINWCRANGIRVGPGRGSAAGSAASYCMGIVGVDPIANNLLFERFMDPDRDEMPDIDTDFEERRRDEVVAYLSRTYDRVDADGLAEIMVARIGTYGVARSRKAVKDVARILDKGDVGDRLAKLVPMDAGKPLSFDQLADESDSRGLEFRRLVDSDPEAAEVVAFARSFENVVAGEGIHACGVLVSDEPLNSLVPLRWDRKSEGGGWITQWDKDDVGDGKGMGLLKLDVLGLRTLDIISEAVRQIERTTGEIVDPDNLPTDTADPRVRAAWKLISSGKTAGVFQISSEGMTKLAQAVQPESLADLSALVALYRPGPMGAGMPERFAKRKNGLEPVDYDVYTTDLDEQAEIATVLGETLGVIAYQESLMRLGTVVGGFGPAMTNRLRRAISKKVRSEIVEIKTLFLTGAQADVNDLGEPKRRFAIATADELWKAFEKSGDYLFNASHSYAYGLIGYMTAFLKANWPACYGAALLAMITDKDQRKATMESLRNEGITILGPDVNDGQADSAVDVDGNVRLGMSEVEGVKTNAAVIIAARESGGKFRDLADLVKRVRSSDGNGAARSMSVSVFESLVESGACDSFAQPRMGMHMVLRALKDVPDLPVPSIEWGVTERSQRERAKLGIAVSGSPLSALAAKLKAWSDPDRRIPAIPMHKVLVQPEGTIVSSIGVIAEYKEWFTKAGDRMSKLTLEGTRASVECVVFPRTFRMLAHSGLLPQVGEVVGITGRVQISSYTLRASDNDFNDGPDDDEIGTHDAAALETVEKHELVVDNIFTGPLDGANELLVAGQGVGVLADVVPLRRGPRPKFPIGPEPHRTNLPSGQPVPCETAAKPTVVELPGLFVIPVEVGSVPGLGRGLHQDCIAEAVGAKTYNALALWLLSAARNGDVSPEYKATDGRRYSFLACSTQTLADALGTTAPALAAVPELAYDVGSASAAGEQTTDGPAAGRVVA